MEFEKCYVFQPDTGRPAKRPRIDAPRGLHASWELRKQAYRDAWSLQQNRIDTRISDINSATVNEIAGFLEEAQETSQLGRIPTCLVLGGPHATLHNTITEQLSRLKSNDGRRLFASLSPASSTNLKAVLKTLIQNATSSIGGIDDDEDEIPGAPARGPRQLSYDLQILADYVRDRKVAQVIVAFEGTEAFDGDLLSELIEILGSWQDRIPFVCLFSIATSVEFLQQRLSPAAIKCLNGRLFDVAPSGEVVEQVFEAVTDPSSALWIGSTLAGLTLERQSDYIQSIDSFVDAVRYAYMSCFYANALSIFLIPNISVKKIPSDHFEALRTLESFRNCAQDLLDNGDPEKVRSLLESDEELFAFTKQQIELGRENLSQIVVATEVVRTIQRSLPGIQVSTKPDLYVQAMSGKLDGSALLRSLLLSVRKAPSDTTITILTDLLSVALPESTMTECQSITTELETLVQLQDQMNDAQPLRSADDVKNSTLRTTIIAQKVELSKQKSSLSKQDTAYTEILRRLTDMLETYFMANLITAEDLPFHEIFLYDLRSPHREVFTPRPRHAVERALASPHDYLDCDCCAPEKNGNNENSNEATLSATQPATAVLYQLYLESGSLINASDLWQAFSAVMGEDKDEQETVALFQRGLAELKYLGFVKGTRKRVDHIAKVAWRGL